MPPQALVTEPLAVAEIVRVLPAHASAGVTQENVEVEQVFGEPVTPVIDSDADVVAERFPPSRGSQRQSPSAVAEPVVPAGGLMFTPDGIGRMTTVSTHDPATGSPEAFEPTPAITTDALTAADAGRAATRLRTVKDETRTPAILLMAAPK
jgi:hypothetical protein